MAASFPRPVGLRPGGCEQLDCGQVAAASCPIPTGERVCLFVAVQPAAGEDGESPPLPLIAWQVEGSKTQE